jgi:hypothetical protein
MPKKNKHEIEADNKRFLEERQQALMQNPEQYMRDFAEALRQFLTQHYPELDPDDQEIQEALKENFIWTTESMALARQYNLGVPWDPTGEEPPTPAITPACREIRCQETAISQNEIRTGQINLGRPKVSGRYLILEIDLDKPTNLIEDCVMHHVANRKKKVKVSASHAEVIKVPEPRVRNSSFTYAKMQVWKMVEEERSSMIEKESEILWRLAKKHCGLSQEDEDYDDRVKVEYKAIKNAYLRDKKLYYGD